MERTVEVPGGKVITMLYGLIAFMIVGWGASLLYYLGAGRVPPPLKPMTNVWVRAGYDPKWITVAMWATFVILALIFLFFVGRPLYYAFID